MITHLCARMNLPKAFIERMQHQLKDEAGDFFESLSTPGPVSLRLNRKKAIEKDGIRVPWCADGVYLETRPSFTLDPLFHAGTYYVQEGSSMFLEQIIGHLGLNNKKIVALDACAAPGGKTTHLSSLLNDESLIVSNETIASRVSVLKENIIKWGRGNVVVTNNDTSAFVPLHGLFDLILMDAPCSGEGLFRKDGVAVNEWSEENCSLCSGRQQRILKNLLPALKEDGILIYCTCTYNPDENEKNVEWICKNHGMKSVPILVKPEWNIKEIGFPDFKAYSFYPHKVRGEGFFVSVLKKRSVVETVSIKKADSKYSLLLSTFASVKDWINESPHLKLYKRDDEIFLLPEAHLNLIEFLARHLRVHYAGSLIGKIKHSNVVPAHDLAMSVHLNREYFPQLNLSKEDALKYLRREDLKVQSPEKGWLLACYKGYPLGWLNNLGNRYNNYYPTEWRIRMKATQQSAE